MIEGNNFLNKNAQCGEQLGNSVGSGSAGYFQDNAQTISAAVELRADKGFDVALNALWNGQRITRAGWNGRGMWVQIQMPDKRSLMSRPYAVLRGAQGDLVPWTPSQGDLFAMDWAIFPV